METGDSFLLKKQIKTRRTNGRRLKNLITTQRMLDTLAIDNPLDYARLYLNSEMQNWVNALMISKRTSCFIFFYNQLNAIIILNYF